MCLVYSNSSALASLFPFGLIMDKRKIKRRNLPYPIVIYNIGLPKLELTNHNFTNVSISFFDFLAETLHKVVSLLIDSTIECNVSFRFAAL